MASLGDEDGLPLGGPPGQASGVLPELEIAQRAMEALVGVLRQRSLLATALRKVTAEGAVERDKVSTEGAELARRRHMAEGMVSVAKRVHALTPVFSSAVDDGDRAVRRLVASSVADGLRAQDRREVDEAFAAILDIAAAVAAAPAVEPDGRTASALRGFGWRRARRAHRRIIAEMHWQWQQLQLATTEWSRLIQDLSRPGALRTCPGRSSGL
jgi:hypothetical protein